jgi:hypothetical protein
VEEGDSTAECKDVEELDVDTDDDVIDDVVEEIVLLLVEEVLGDDVEVGRVLAELLVVRAVEVVLGLDVI